MKLSKPWPWDYYVTYLEREWSLVLERSGSDETIIQQFLEQHPCLLPGGEASLESIGGHHGPFPGAVISQPRLTGDKEYIPDFLWLTKHSGAFIPVFIELKSADKKWFTKGRYFTADLNKTIGQIVEWRSWINTPENSLQFYNRFGISDSIRDHLEIKPNYYLIYGRREEFSNTDLRKKRETCRPEWLQWSTYDRLKPDYDSRNWITIKIQKGQWTVVCIPPTFDLEAIDDSHLDNLVGLDTAIKNNSLISGLRKTRLLQELNCIKNCSDITKKFEGLKINRRPGDLDKHIISRHSNLS